MKSGFSRLIIVSMVFAFCGWRADAEIAGPRTVALVVQNHAETGVQIPMLALSDALVARLSGGTFKVVNPYNVVGKTENRTQSGEALPEMPAVGLAEELGAQGVITVAVVSFLDKKIGTPPNSRRFVMRMVINLVEVSTGAAVFGECVEVESPRYKITEDGGTLIDQINKLMYSAADKCAELLEEKAKGWEPTPPPVVVVPPPDNPGGDVIIITPPERPEPPREKIWRKDPPPEVEDFTMADFDKMFESLVKNMLDDSRFKENYEQAQTEKSGLPIVIVGGVTNKSDGAAAQVYAEFLKAIPDTLRIELFNSNLFDVKHDELSVMFAQRILASDKSPVEDGELMSALKQHGSPDFVIIGDIRLFAEQTKRKTCRFHLALHSLKTGKVVWEGKLTAIK